MTATTLGPCVLWDGQRDHHGYARVGRRLVHRDAYEAVFGTVPDGLELDHLCHTRDATCPGGTACPHRRCINPFHLEPVTHRENSIRGRSFAARNLLKTHCPMGHPYDEANTYVLVRASHVSRCCRACNRAAVRRYKAKAS